MKININEIKKSCKENRPLYKIGDVVVVESEFDPEKVVQGIIKTAEFTAEWFYGIDISDMSGSEKTRTYSYEVDTGDARTKILYKIV